MQCSDRSYIWNLEFSTNYDANLILRALEYDVRHRVSNPTLRMESTILLLSPKADHYSFQGGLEGRVAGKDQSLLFRYKGIRLWQLSPANIIQSGVGVLPLAPATNVQATDLPDVLRQMNERFTNECDYSEIASFWMVSEILAGFKFPNAVITPLIMEEKSSKNLRLTKPSSKMNVKKSLSTKSNLLRLGRRN